MRRAARKGAVGTPPGEMTSALAAEPVTIGYSPTPPSSIAAAHRELVGAYGLLISLPEVETALRKTERFYGARNLLLRHLAIARGES